MINIGLRARRVEIGDRDQVSNLLLNETNAHRHLDWRSPLEWVGSPYYWALDENGHVSAAFACPEDPPQVAWIRLFAHESHLSGPEAWRALWDLASAEIIYSEAKTQVAAIVVKHWFQKLLISSGFEVKQNIILLELRSENVKQLNASHAIRIRSMLQSDMPAVALVDLDAFGWFWHNSMETLERARLQAVIATVAENESGVIGYQLSTGNLLGAHLARLAVRKEAQGQGVGSALVNDLIQKLGGSQMGRLSVNTQGDNDASLALYQRVGFVRTGEFFPVLVYPTGS